MKRVLMKRVLMKRVLHVFPLCGRAGTEAVMRFVIAGMEREGIQSEAFFQRDIGGSDLFRALCPIHFEDDISLEQVLARGNFDAIHAITSSNTIGLPEAMARTGFKGPVVAACHNDYVVGWNRANANAIIALTEWWAEKIRPYTDLPVRVIGNPVDLERFRPPDAAERTAAGGKRPLLAWIGRSADLKKNVARLKAIIAALPPDAYDIRVADTDTREDPREVFGDLAERLGWYGRLHYTRMPEFYREIAATGGVLLSTSDDEAFPMCILEAMASGCAVVVPDAWGSGEIVGEGVSGLVYRRAEGIQDALRCLKEAADPARHASLGAAARERVEREYSQEAVTEQYLTAFREALSQPRRTDAAYGLSWAARSAGFYLRQPPQSIWLYRPRRAAEALERALRAQQAGQAERARAALLEALQFQPTAYLRPWRAKFLIKSLLHRA